MLMILLLACGGLLWLAHRFSLLLSLPVEITVKSLSIPIPKIPLISIDKVSSKTIVFHWTKQSDDDLNIEKEEFNDLKNDINIKLDINKTHSNNLDDLKDDSSSLLSSDISYFILYINGIETAVINGELNRCVLEDLQPDTDYQIDLVPFNIAGFRSRSIPVYIKTSPKEMENYLNDSEDPDQMIQSILREREKTLISENNDQKSPYYISNRIKNSIQNENSYTSNSQHPQVIEDINELRWILITSLDEVDTLTNTRKEVRDEIKEEEINLLATRDEAKERRKFEDNNRINLRQEIKLLEEQRVKGTGRIAADEKKIKERLKKIENSKSQIETWNAEIEKMKTEKDSISVQHPDSLSKLKEEIVNLNKDIFSLQEEVHEVEAELRDEITKRKLLENQKIKVFELFENINKNIDVNTGLLSKEGMKYLDELSELKPEWKDELIKEIVLIDEKAESDYKALQQKEFLNFNKMKLEYDEQRKLALLQSSNNSANNHPNKIPLSAHMAIKNNENDTTTATTTTTVNGYLYNTLPTSSSASIVNAFNSQPFNGTSMRNLMRPRISTAGSFHGSDMLSDQLPRHDSTVNTFSSANNTSNNLWSMNLSLDSNPNIMINNNVEPTSVNMLLPQNLIDGEDFDQLFETQSKNQINDINSLSVLSPSLSGLSSQAQNPPSSALSNLGGSPNLSQINGFDVYQNPSINSMVLNSTPQNNNKVNSLNVLASGTSQNNIILSQSQSSQQAQPPLSSSAGQINLIGSPQSLNAHLSHVDGSNMIDMHAATRSPFDSKEPINLSLNSNVSNELKPISSIFSTNSNNHHYSKIFGLFGNNSSNNNNNNNNNSHITNTNNNQHNTADYDNNHHSNNKLANMKNNSNATKNMNNNLDINLSDPTADFALSRGRSTSFGSSIWSNGNNGNGHNSNNNTWGTTSSMNKPNGFSFLGAPISMTSTTENESSNQNKNLYISHQQINHINDLSEKDFSNNESIGAEINNTYYHSASNSISTNLNDEDHIRHSDDIQHPTSPSFLKSMIGKLGASPTKTLSGKTFENTSIIEEEYDDSVDKNLHKNRKNSENSQGHQKTSSLGSSRFFKLPRKNSIISTSQHSAITNGSTDSNNGVIDEDLNNNSSGFMGRKLSFAFKREKVEKLEKNE
jgi:hypothetical protein